MAEDPPEKGAQGSYRDARREVTVTKALTGALSLLQGVLLWKVGGHYYLC